MTKWVGDTLQAMQLQEPQTIEERCPHCGVPVRYPLMVRRGDIDLFEQMMATANKVMLDYGITGNLLADIRARCLIAIAQKATGQEPQKED